MQTLNAIYENGMFRPLEPINIPNACIVKIQIQPQQDVVRQATLLSTATLPNADLSAEDQAIWEQFSDFRAKIPFNLRSLEKQP